MEAEDVGMNEMGQSLDMVNIVLVGVQLGDFEVILGTKLVILIAEDVIIEIVIQQSDDEPPILVVSDSASVVALSS